MGLRVVLVEPGLDGNLGFCARAMKNLWCRELVLVRPRADKGSAEARARAMKAVEVLENARVVESLEEALKGCTYSVAATAKQGQGSCSPRNALSLKEFAEEFAPAREKIALVFGPERAGLKTEDIRKCDVVVRVPTSQAYPSMNLSHAVAVVLYELHRCRRFPSFKSASGEKKKFIEKMLLDGIENSSGIKSVKGVKNSVKAFLNRARLSEKEANALITALTRKKGGT